MTWCKARRGDMLRRAMTTQRELEQELDAIDAQLEKARGEIEHKLAVRVPFDPTFAMVPTFKFVIA